MLAELTTRLEDGENFDVLVWRLPQPMLCASTTTVGGGIGTRNWALNVEVPDSYARVDIDRHIAEVAATLELHGDGVGMLTAARVRRYQSFADQGVDVAVTVGLSHPTWASSNETLSNQPIGTINIVCFLPVRLENGALLNALTTATEAKSQALWDAAIPGTGTASDAICIFCPLDAEVAVFAGPRSQWGSRLARTVYRSVLAGAQAPVS